MNAEKKIMIRIVDSGAKFRAKAELSNNQAGSFDKVVSNPFSRFKLNINEELLA